jgi:FkbM family methyltransferase
MTPLQRSLMTISCRDSDPIAKVPDAGRTLEVDGERVQVMHNGIRVVHGGYHGDWMAHIIRGLQGHHEPQEELVFDRLLRYVRDGSLIVELGAFWAYYTQWYLRDVPGSRALCIEPDPHNLSIGRRNAALNGNAARIRFEQAWIGGEPAAAHSAVGESSPEPLVLPQLDFAGVRALCPQAPIEVLHLDIQGAELGFLRSIATAGIARSGRWRRCRCCATAIPCWRRPASWSSTSMGCAPRAGHRCFRPTRPRRCGCACSTARSTTT